MSFELLGHTVPYLKALCTLSLSIALLKMCILHHMIPGVYISTKNQNFSVSGFQTLKLFRGSIAMTYCFQPKN